MQLVAYGAQDIYLTGNPQITFFKIVYRRHTNFSMETISQTLDGNATIGTSTNEASCTISRNGDLIHKMYIAILSANSVGIEFGSEIVQSTELEIGGQLIDKHTAEWNNVWNELSLPNSKARGLMSMLSENIKIESKLDEDTHLTSDSVGMVQVPLNFYFCRNSGLALPLIALQYHEVKINFVFGTTTSTGATDGSHVKFYVDYIYLDTDERRRFAQVSHEYLIEQVQMQTMTSDVIQELTFNHPVKELIWLTDKTNSYDTALLKLNGHDRFEKQEEEYFQLRQPFDYHTAVPKHNLPLISQISHKIQIEHTEHIFATKDGLSVKNPKADLGSAGFLDNLNGGKFYTITKDISAPIDAEQTFALVTNPADMFFIFLTTDLSGTFKPNHKYRFKFNKHMIPGAGDHPLPLLVMSPLQSLTRDVMVSTVLTGGDGGAGAIGDTNLTLVTFTELITKTGALKGLRVHGSGAGDQIDADDYKFLDFVLTQDQRANFMRIMSIEEISTAHGTLNTARTSKLDKKINVYSFALKPEEHQPSGTCNFSRIDSATLEFGSSPTGSNGHIYAVNYNVLRIMSGMGGLAYSN